MRDLEGNSTQVRTDEVSSDLYPLKFQIHVPHLDSASTRAFDKNGGPAESAAVLTFNHLAAMLNNTTGTENWAPILAQAATQCSPDSVCPDGITLATTTLLTAVLASVDAKGHDRKSRRTARVLRRFTWLNRMNLLLYQHELTAMEDDFRQNLSSLLDAKAVDKMRNTLEAYSMIPNVGCLTVLDAALVKYQQIVRMDEPGFDEALPTQHLFKQLVKSYGQNMEANLGDNLKVAPERLDPVRVFIDNWLPPWFAYSGTQRSYFKSLAENSIDPYIMNSRTGLMNCDR